jgi:hypothetical protein
MFIYEGNKIINFKNERSQLYFMFICAKWDINTKSKKMKESRLEKK